ncbi:MAG: tetratricopeptide repeat protein [Kiritimatiellae bacterium]|nr:tetratricopeptide repeat protein [Kiritimatiellia bacterium]
MDLRKATAWAVLAALAAGVAVAQEPAEPVEGADTRGAAVKQLVEQGNKQMQAARYDAAMEAFEQALALDPRSREARFGLGTTHIQREEFREAIRVLEPMMEQYPDDYFLKNNIAWLYATAKDHSVRNGARAVALAQEALLIAPRDYHVWSTLAEAYYVSGRYERALRAAEEALRLVTESTGDPQNIREYRDQIAKCRKAVEAMSLLE